MAKKRTPAKRPPAPSPYQAQIEAEATEKFLPEQTALKQALSDALSQRDAAISSASAASDASVRATQSVVPTVRAAADSSDQRLSDLLSQSTGANETADLRRTRSVLSSTMAGATANLGDYAKQAASGRLFAVNSANDRYDANLGKITQQNMDLSARAGAFAQGRLGQLSKDASDQQFTATQKSLDRRTTREVAAAHDATGLTKAALSAKAAERKGKAVSRATPIQQQKASSDLARAISMAKTMTTGEYDPNVVLTVLTQGRTAAPGREVADPVLGPDKQPVRDANGAVVMRPRYNEDGTKATVGGRTAVAPVAPALATAAYEVATTGGLSPKSVKALQALGYTIRDLGVPTKTQLMRKGAYPAPRPTPTGVLAPRPNVRVKPPGSMLPSW